MTARLWNRGKVA